LNRKIGEQIIFCYFIGMGGSESKGLWQEDYLLVSPATVNPLLLKEKRTGIRCQLFKLLVDVEHCKQETERIQKRLGENKAKYLTPLVDWRKGNGQGMCGNKEQMEVLFGDVGPSLEDLFKYRRKHNEGFSADEIKYIIRNVALGLKEVQMMGEEHGRVDLFSICVSKDLFLKDSLLVDY
jgi:hypothetical protein